MNRPGNFITINMERTSMHNEMMAEMKKMTEKREKELAVIKPFMDRTNRDAGLDAGIEYTCMEFAKWLTRNVDSEHDKTKDVFAKLGELMDLVKETHWKRGKFEGTEGMSSTLLCRFKDADGDFL